MNLPPVQRFDANAYQVGQSLQQVQGRQATLADTERAQRASALLNAYKVQVDNAGGMTAKRQLLENLMNSGLAAQSTDLGESLMKYAGLA